RVLRQLGRWTVEGRLAPCCPRTLRPRPRRRASRPASGQGVPPPVGEHAHYCLGPSDNRRAGCGLSSNPVPAISAETLPCRVELPDHLPECSSARPSGACVALAAPAQPTATPPRRRAA